MGKLQYIMIRDFGIKFLLILLFLCTNNIVRAQGFGSSQKLDQWYFHFGDVHLGGRKTLDHSQWEKVVLPHDWSVSFPASPHLASCTGYLPGGIAWYRTDLEIPLDSMGKRMYLYFGGVYRNSEVYINGKWLGKRPNGYVSFLYEITDYINPGEKNVVAVRVDHEEDADSRWYTGSGIYREVQLITANTAHFDLWGIHYTAQIVENRAKLNVSSQLNSSLGSTTYTVRHELIDNLGNTVDSISNSVSVDKNGKGHINQKLEVDNPILWDVDNPYLYRLKSTLYNTDKIIDTSTTSVGIRSIEFDAIKGFSLNGNNMKIKGVCLHHDAGVLGAAVPKSVWRKRILKLKEIGVNGIRMSHNPQATDLYDLCDELSMLVMDEAFDEWEYPKKKWIKGWNVGKPGHQGFAKYFREWGKKDLESIVKRNRNHTSIIMWSIGNEVDYPNDPYSHPILDIGSISQHLPVRGYRKDQPHADRLGDIAKELVPIVKAIDSTRPVTAAIAGAIMSNETDYPEALDIVGYNYTEYKYDEDHAAYPNRILFGSETRHDMEAWKSVRDKDFIFGQFIWTGIDYLGEAGIWPSRGFTSGMIDLANNIKPRGYFRQSLWTDKPMVYLGTYPLEGNDDELSIDAPSIWNYVLGQKIRVVCYTNTEKVVLFLNGKKVGKAKKYDDVTGIIHWDIPYEKGVLKAVGHNGKEIVTTTVLHTSEKPESLRLKMEQSRLSSKNDVAIIKVSAVDTNGNLANLASNEITCTVSGPGTLLGIENASDNVAEDYTNNSHRLLNGKATIYIRATKDSGDIDVHISSPYLATVVEKLQIGKGE